MHFKHSLVLLLLHYNFRETLNIGNSHNPTKVTLNTITKRKTHVKNDY
jgi:hypothetical protein